MPKAFITPPTLRQASAAQKIIATFAVLAGLFHSMHHRLAALGAGLARGFGKGLQFFFKLGMGSTDNSAVFCFSNFM